ncbi:PAS domain-containing protein [Dethiosulfovibrio salsuginis]|uniref:GGDEF domain-containing protein, diguanylate cyclase (C-di-GMP synthetase) or its enzymatically inactive variants n=1 Tax=Dethiosulfovibrio salsuginis TaxID=561720 RepID=A0A1X7JMT9_9BACT|nr:PAS domain-containing protein [Dethiosulfovibrio salsuginis]SMG28962.1 hypothetical protein SAMN06275492_11355 [Dethiosulfovibrio salsuginis]
MSTPNEKDERGTASWLTVPPIPTLVIAIALLPFSSESKSISMGATFWLFVTMIYMSISVSYVICLGRNAKDGLAPLQILGQGVALLVLPLGLGAPYGLSWIGLALSFAGTVILVNKVMTIMDAPQKAEETETPEQQGSFLEGVPLPTLDVDGDGLILGANTDMLDLLEVEEDVLLGQKAEMIFPQDIDRIDVRGKGWQVLRKPGEGGSELICLIEEVSPPPPREAEEKGEMIHPETGLFSAPYAKIMIPAELKRSIRYRRWLSMIAIRIKLVTNGQETDVQTKEKILNSYGFFIKKNIRECDLGFFMENGNYMILLPETPNAGAKTALDKLKKVPEDILKEVGPETDLSLWGGIFHCSGHEKIDYNGAMAALEENVKELEHFEPLPPKLEA